MAKHTLTLLFVCLFCSGTLLAQINPFPSPYLSLDTSYRSELALESFYLTNSTSLNANFLRHYQFQPVLSREVINNTEPRLKEKNRAGINFMNTLSYTHISDSSFLGKNIAYIFSYTNQTMAGINFTGDAYRFALIGNTHYKGEELKVGPMDTRKQSFSTIKAAAYQTVGQWQFGGGIGFVAGHSFSFGHINEGTLYTSPDADSLYVEVDMNSARSPNTPNWMGTLQIRGVGALADLSLKYSQENYSATLMAENIGFVYWTQPTVYNEADTSLSFTGFEYDELVSGNGNYRGIFALPGQFRQNSDDLIKTRMLPWRVRLHQHMALNNIKSDVTLGILYEYLPGFSPYVYGLINHSATNYLDLMGGLTFGGYGGAGLTLGTSLKVSGYTIGLAGYNVFSFVVPEETGGTSLQIRLSKKFAKPVKEELPPPPSF